ncbi:MAG: NAD-dependent epimerase/dehydratase family protein [Rhodospirillaceae bacterium]|nr:NAD-dependent epimerase/dehydratase family protein [Rhodospirillales bacterium]
MTGEPVPFFRGQRCLVAGGTGFVGCHFVEALLAAGAQIRVPVHHRPPLVQDERIEYIAADLAQREDCLRVMDGMDMLIHAAGSVGAAGVAPQDALLGMGTNLNLTANLLWAAWGAGISRALVFSSSTGYPAADHAMAEDEFWEGDVHPSYHGYGWMRRYVERLAEFTAQRSKLHVCIVRPGAIYGRHDNFDPRCGHVVPSLIRRAEARENPFEVWGTGDEVRDLLHVRDFVRGCLLALEKSGNCDPINIASGQGTSVRELVTRVLAASAHRPDIVFDPSRPTAIPIRLMDIAKARRLLGFAPTISLADGLADTVQWFREALP